MYLLLKSLDENVVPLHLHALGANLANLTKEQANYIKVDDHGSFKGSYYRY